jgi:hypothetical protein
MPCDEPLRRQTDFRFRSAGPSCTRPRASGSLDHPPDAVQQPRADAAEPRPRHASGVPSSEYERSRGSRPPDRRHNANGDDHGDSDQPACYQDGVQNLPWRDWPQDESGREAGSREVVERRTWAPRCGCRHGGAASPLQAPGRPRRSQFPVSADTTVAPLFIQPPWPSRLLGRPGGTIVPAAGREAGFSLALWSGRVELFPTLCLAHRAKSRNTHITKSCNHSPCKRTACAYDQTVRDHGEVCYNPKICALTLLGPLPVPASQHVRASPVEVASLLVVPARGPRVLVPGEVLHIAEAHHIQQFGDRGRSE